MVIGDLFSGGRPARDLPRLIIDEPAQFLRFCRAVLADYWGSYVAVRHHPGEQAPCCVYPEPMGMRDCVTWCHGGVRFLTCDPMRWLTTFPPRDLAIDLDEMAQLVAFPAAITDARPLSGVTILEPGALSCLGAAGWRVERLWTPRNFTTSGTPPGDPAALEQRVDDCLGAWSAVGGPAVIELSGGLDSAMVAASAVRARIPIARAFTFFSDELSGDERRFSRAIAEHLDIKTTELMLAPGSVCRRAGSTASIGIRPGLGATSLFHDDRLASEGQGLGAHMLLTGRGGDAVFFQHPTVAVAADPWAPGQQRSRRRLEALARWSQTSIWQVAAPLWLPHLGGPNLADKKASRFAAEPKVWRPLDWPGSLKGLSPAKRMQILAIAQDRSAFGPSACSQAMRVIHPLLSQPLVEWALGQSIMTLTDGRRDRALARAAYAGQLPAPVVTRPGKGALGTFFGRALALNVAALRSELLEGRLADAGLINRARLEAVLDPDYLMREDCYSALLSLIVLERWMQGWQDRLRLMSR